MEGPRLQRLSVMPYFAPVAGGLVGWFVLSQIEYWLRKRPDELRAFQEEEQARLIDPSVEPSRGWVTIVRKYLEKASAGMIGQKAMQRAITELLDNSVIFRRHVSARKPPEFRLNMGKIVEKLHSLKFDSRQLGDWEIIHTRFVDTSTVNINDGSELRATTSKDDTGQIVHHTKPGMGGQIVQGGWTGCPGGVDNLSTLKVILKVSPKENLPNPPSGGISNSSLPHTDPDADQLTSLTREVLDPFEGKHVEALKAAEVVPGSKLGQALLSCLSPGLEWTPGEARQFVKALRSGRLSAGVIVGLLWAVDRGEISIEKNSLRSTLDGATVLAETVRTRLAERIGEVERRLLDLDDERADDEGMKRWLWRANRDAAALCGRSESAEKTLMGGRPRSVSATAVMLVHQWALRGFEDRRACLGAVREELCREVREKGVLRRAVLRHGDRDIEHIWGLRREEIERPRDAERNELTEELGDLRAMMR